MNITEFTAFAAQKLEEYLRGELQDDVKVQPEEVLKINDRKLHGLTIMKGDGPAPTYYLDELFEMVCHGADPDFLIHNMADNYMALSAHGPMPSEELPDMEYQTIKRRTGLRLVGKDYNKEFLKTVPFKDVGNGYALLCDVHIKASDGGMFSTLVTNEMAEQYNYDMDCLFSNALDNAWKSKSAVFQGAGEYTGPVTERETCYVLTTQQGRFGAAALFYPGTQAMIAHVLEEDYFAIPSSLHEFMIIRESEVSSPSLLYHFVREANGTIVDPEDVLSDVILKYSRDTGELTVLPENEDLCFGFAESLQPEWTGQNYGQAGLC